MSAGFIIVERDLDLKDSGVFTGQIQIIETRYMFYDNERTKPCHASDGVSSPDLEHAFVFHAASTAWRYAMNFEPHWDESRRRYFAFRRWIVRADGEFYPGQCILRQEPVNIYAGWHNQREQIMRATMAGFQQGRESALREMQ